MRKKSAAKGTFKSRFTSKEWDQVVWVPLHILMTTAFADGTFDEEEAEQIAEGTLVGLVSKDPLYREVAKDLAVAIGSKDFRLFSLDANPFAVRALLESKLSEDEYQGFLRAVLGFAVAVARASDGISQDEQSLLVDIAAVWGLRTGAR